MIQMRVDGGCPTENLARAEARIEEAAREGAQVAVLPEALNLGWTHPSAALGAELIPEGETVQRLRQSGTLNDSDQSKRLGQILPA